MNLKLKSNIAAMIILLGFAFSVDAQTGTEAVDALKDGVAKSQAKDYLGAIKSFKQCISIYDALDESDNENKATAETQIPNMQYKYAISLYKQKKYDESISAFTVLKEYSETYNDPKNLKKANGTIPKLYYAKGASLLKTKDYTGALEALNTAIEMNPKYPMSYVRKAQVYKEQNDEANFKIAINDAINASVTKKDVKTEATAKKLASSFYLNSGVKAVKAEKYNDAEMYFNTLLEYKEGSSDIYYQLAVIYNKQSKWDAAIESGNKALELFKNADTIKDAKIYYELGNSYYGKGDNAAACDAYSKANKGNYAETAAYQIKTVLKCH